MIKKVLTRAISGLIFLIVVIGAIFWGEIPYSIIFLFVTVMCLFEFYRALNNIGILAKVCCEFRVGFYGYLRIFCESFFNPELPLSDGEK